MRDPSSSCLSILMSWWEISAYQLDDNLNFLRLQQISFGTKWSERRGAYDQRMDSKHISHTLTPDIHSDATISIPDRDFHWNPPKVFRLWLGRHHVPLVPRADCFRPNLEAHIYQGLSGGTAIWGYRATLLQAQTTPKDYHFELIECSSPWWVACLFLPENTLCVYHSHDTSSQVQSLLRLQSIGRHVGVMNEYCGNYCIIYLQTLFLCLLFYSRICWSTSGQ